MTVAAGPDAAAAGDRVARLNAVVLSIASGLAGANAAVVFATGGLVGRSLAGDVALATVPLSCFVLGTALATIPIAQAARLIGRRAVFMIGNLSGALAGLLSALAVLTGSFWLFCAATSIAGVYQAVVVSYRYAAADTATPGFRPKAIAYVQTGGVAAAIIGPQLVIWTQASLPPYLFLGTFIGQAVVALLAIAVTRRFVEPPPSPIADGSGRPLSVILKNPRLIVAILCGTVAQALMNMVMTAAPLAMAICGHSIVDSTLGIQWHVIAMFAPSFWTGGLIQRFGKERVVAAGLAILASCGLVHLAGITVMHFWVALVLLGLGWNLAYIGATAMVTDCHNAAERAKVQGFNDFCIFGTTAVGSFLAGHLLATVGWDAINMALVPLAALCLVALAFGARRPVPQA